jgi:hypothetical protein
VAERLKKSYERVNPSQYGYSNPNHQQAMLYNAVSQEYKVVGPVISTQNERGAPRGQSSKPSWWG